VLTLTLVVAVAVAVVAAVLLVRPTQTSPSHGGGPSTSSAVIAPLTGLTDPSDLTSHRCAVTVKVDNTPEARPQYGVEQADVVYEEVVEGNITRLAAVFNSRAPTRVGPVRSVRRTDQSIVWPLRGIFAYSGGAPYAIASIDTAPVTQLDEARAGTTMWRDPNRSAPHNLYARVDRMYARCADPPPPALFTYRTSTERPGGSAVVSLHVGFESGYAVTWSWDASTGTWARSIFGGPEVAASRTPLTTVNIVVMFVHYVGGVGVEGAEATLTGQGPAWVFSDGRVTKGTWSRPDKQHPAQLRDGLGQPMRLTAGPTWVELPDASYTVTIRAAAHG